MKVCDNCHAKHNDDVAICDCGYSLNNSPVVGDYTPPPKTNSDYRHTQKSGFFSSVLFF